MAHIFLQAPNTLTIKEAIRWAQIINIGGDKRFAQVILGTFLGRFDSTKSVKSSNRKEEFWETVFRWFIRHPMIDPNQIGPIIDYIDNRKYRRQINVFIDGVLHDFADPPEPNLTMKNRDPAVLMRLVEEWHNELARDELVRDDRNVKDTKNLKWTTSGIKNFDRTEGVKKKITWRITELLSSKELYAEGKAMKHLVYSSSNSCALKRCAIFSVTKYSENDMRNILTIEVNIQIRKQIVQARGKLNSVPTDKSRKIVGMWAQKEGISISKYVWKRSW